MEACDVPAPNGGLLGLSARLRCPPRTNLAVLLAESFNPSGGVHNPVLSREKRMAGGTDFETKIASPGGTGHETRAAGTSNVDFLVIGVDTGAHLKGANDSSR